MAISNTVKHKGWVVYALFSAMTQTCVVLRVRIFCGRLGGRWRLGQFKVIFALFAHPVRIGAAGVPLDTNPAIFSQLPNHTAQAWWWSILTHTKQKRE